REPIACGAAVIYEAFDYFNPCVAAEQTANHSFSRRQLEPAVLVMPAQPAFGGKINKLCAKKSAPKRSEVDQKQSRVTPCQSRPENKAEADPRQHQPAVSG